MKLAFYFETGAPWVKEERFFSRAYLETMQLSASRARELGYMFHFSFLKFFSKDAQMNQIIRISVFFIFP